MKQPTARRVHRWLAAVITVAFLVTSQGGPGEAASFDATKLDPAFLQELLANPDGEYEVIVRAKSTVSPRLSKQKAAARASDGDKEKEREDKEEREKPDRAGKAVLKIGGRSHYPLGIVGGAFATAEGKKILELTRDGDVDYIVRNQQVRSHDDDDDEDNAEERAKKLKTPGLLAIDANDAWAAYGVSGRGIGVAVVDSGVYPHRDLAGRIVASIDFTLATPRVVVGPSAVGDPGGHGTHVAGLVAGDGTASAGAWTGVAPEANIIDVRVIDANGSSNTAIILRAMAWILNNRATYNIRVANLSFGAPVTGSYKTDLMGAAAEILIFAGVAVVASAGNGGPEPWTITSPGNNPYVITVGAIDDAGTTDTRQHRVASFSARGPTEFDKVDKPDLVAPGRKMVSLLAPGATLTTTYREREVTAPGATTAGYFSMSGTSMAAAVVSGTIALMLERDPSLAPKHLKKRLKETATLFRQGDADDEDRGEGVVDVEAAVGSRESRAAISRHRVTDAFAKDVLRLIQGQPITWKNKNYHDKVDSAGITWENITWENITWDSITWENISWESFTWESITWENVTWESVTWEVVGSLSIRAVSGNGDGTSGWELVD